MKYLKVLILSGHVLTGLVPFGTVRYYNADQLTGYMSSIMLQCLWPILTLSMFNL